MKLSFGSAFWKLYEKYSRSDMLKICKEIGFSCYDLSIPNNKIDTKTPEAVEENAEKWKKLFDDAEIKVTQTHAPAKLDEIIGTLYFCQKAGFPNTVIHPIAKSGNTRDEFFEANLKFVRSLIPHIEATGTELLMENIGQYTDPYFFWSGKDLREFIDEVNHPLVNACWDIGHANHFYTMHGGSPYDSITALGDKLKAIHAHDNEGYFIAHKQGMIDMHLIPYASCYSSVNWDAVMQGLKDAKYKGTFNFEAPCTWASTRAEKFVYNGEVVNRVREPSFEVWKAGTQLLHAIGKSMLEEYGMYEE